jgi:translation initiation factor IF-3
MAMALVNNLRIVQVCQTFQFWKSNLLNVKNIINTNNTLLLNVLHSKTFSSNAEQNDFETYENNSLNENVGSIMLKLPDDKIVLTTLSQAKQLSITKNMKLIKMNEVNKSDKPLYKLVSGTYIQDENLGQQLSKKKNLKHIRISTNISDHDLKTKIKSMAGFLQKNLSVTTSINTAVNPSKEVICI